MNGNCQMGSGSAGSSNSGGSDGGIDLGDGITLGGSSAGATRGRTLKDPGCACAVVGRTPAGGVAILLMGFGFLLGAARRRRQAA